MYYSRLLLFFSLVLLPTLISCKNRNVSEDVRRYCDCLADYQANPEGRETCFEMMDEIKNKYKGDNRALMQILEETDGCL